MNCESSSPAEKPDISFKEKETQLVPVPFTPSDLQEKVFETGDKQFFMLDSCSFYFDCDCCAGNIYFNSDLTYYIHDWCTITDSYSGGSYSISGDTVILHSSGLFSSTIYNEAKEENDHTSPEFFYKDTCVSSEFTKFLTFKCGQKIVLKQINGSEFAVETNGNYQKCIQEMKQAGFVRRLDSLKYSK